MIPQLIVFEGIDNSGKSTISKQVYEELCKRNINDKILYIRFPNEKTEYTKKIRSLLNNKIDNNDLSLLLLFTLDRFITFADIGDKLQEYKYIICDRYILSNIMYQYTLTDNKDIIDFIINLEVRNLPLLRIDKCFIIDRGVKEKKYIDKFENIEFQEKLYNNYMNIDKILNIKDILTETGKLYYIKNEENKINETIDNIIKNILE